MSPVSELVRIVANEVKSFGNIEDNEVVDRIIAEVSDEITRELIIVILNGLEKKTQEIIKSE